VTIADCGLMIADHHFRFSNLQLFESSSFRLLKIAELKSEISNPQSKIRNRQCLIETIE